MIEPSPDRRVSLSAAKSIEYRSSSWARIAVLRLGPAPPVVSSNRDLTFQVATRNGIVFLVLVFLPHFRMPSSGVGPNRG